MTPFPLHFAGTAGTESVSAVRLEGPGGLAATVLEYGAVLQSLTLTGPDGRPHPLVLGFDTLDAYLADRNFVGRIVGRHANRIGGGRFHLEGRHHRLTLNERDRTHLHGGTDGFWNRIWRVFDHTRTGVTLGLVSPDGDQGYPGRLDARCTYDLVAPATLRVTLTATTDRPTIVNLACHSYFRLDENGTTRDLDLQVAADAFTPVDADLIPAGPITPVEGTDFDFRAARRVGTSAVPLDINYVLRPRADGSEPAARLSSDRTGLVLVVATTEPGLQVYDGHLMPAGPGWMRPHAGFCLEGQRFPDGPNRPDFPTPLLRPGDTYRQVTEYRFTWA